ncbi:hypothetical protein DJ86_5363 [Bacillus cereus ATCC 4342]|uniref:hypothetical protein n=1 Tax=Bacillus tropicus TaxID=2026188 RepID=UPI0001A01458|nr:hypothetical protein [Bacillus tropicus]AJH71627.1 hypothetical protein BF35_5448 [Bacillus cereus ATCC 4342]EEK81118.1 hypothetical protein bcere0010_53020 [Bacillus cereus ATCC 4342]KFM89786.1 hypothetical protein DJ86_5363 [Bacillus cereus ATCC 4342]MDR4453316.1 hypothetical protein [Bacillus tropicus]QKH59176.1 hypothetical protein FOC76_27050 [Bacillus tropicus]
MSLTSKLAAKNKKDREFKEIFVSVEPNQNDYYTLSGKEPFSEEYTMYVPYNLSSTYNASLVGIAFDYLARFRIAQFIKDDTVTQNMVALNGFKKLRRYKRDLSFEVYISWAEQIQEFVNDSTMPISHLYEIAVRLAKLEQIARTRVNEADINIDYFINETALIEVVNELDNLIVLFEERFMIPEIINEKSNVIFNPKFGVSSSLVGGADADIYIDGVLYDFKTTKDKALKQKDNLQMIGYYILNELAIITISDDLGFLYTSMSIEKMAFYKARFGEIEYYDVEKHLPYKDVKPKLKQLAEYFTKNPGCLNLVSGFEDVETAKEILKSIANEE